jgi:hypothetical protein
MSGFRRGQDLMFSFDEFVVHPIVGELFERLPTEQIGGRCHLVKPVESRADTVLKKPSMRK